MTDRVLQTAAEIVSAASRDKPADAVLRTELRSRSGISREAGREISEAVYACFRWRGWLDSKEAVPQQISRALELQRAFRKRPDGIPDDELRRAIPKWVGDCMDVSLAWLRALQTEPVLWLRARPGQGRGLAERLLDSQVSAALPDALIYEGTQDLFRTPEFHAGEFELQDVSSQIVSLLCDPQPGETWWDACAGEGGKLLHLCDLMQNKGRVWATDRVAWRLQQLKRRTARARLFNYRSELWNGGPKLPTKTKFDGILVDAPCAGLGTWQRNPHARWTTQSQDVRELADAQTKLLRNVVPALKPGGRLVYSVCTLTRAETTEVVETISREFPDLKSLPLRNPLEAGRPAEHPLWLWPQVVRGNGMFIAAWRKNG